MVAVRGHVRVHAHVWVHHSVVALIGHMHRMRVRHWWTEIGHGSHLDRAQLSLFLRSTQGLHISLVLINDHRVGRITNTRGPFPQPHIFLDLPVSPPRPLPLPGHVPDPPIFVGQLDNILVEDIVLDIVLVFLGLDMLRIGRFTCR